MHHRHDLPSRDLGSHGKEQARRIDLAEGGSECVTLRRSERTEGVICVGGLVEEHRVVHRVVHQGGEELPAPRWSWRGRHPRNPSHGKVSWLSS